MIKRHPWFTFYSFGIGLIADLIALIISLCLHKSDAIFITSIVVTLLYLLFFILFANSGVRKRFYEKDDNSSNDYKHISLLAFGIQLVICVIVIIVSLCVK